MQNPTKICYVVPDFNVETKDHFYHHYEMIEKISGKMDVFLIAEKGNKEAKKMISCAKRKYIQRFKFLPLRFLENLLVLLWAVILGYKIFYIHYGYISGVNAGILSRIFKGKSYYWNCAANWLFRQKTLAGFGYKLSMKFCHYLVTGAETMKKGYFENYNISLEKIKVLPNWINLERFKVRSSKFEGKKTPSPKPQTKKHLLFVHWLSKRKGADLIAPIVKILKGKIKNFEVTVIGEGPYTNELLRELEDHKLKRFVNVIGGVPNKDLMEYYLKADLFINPSMEEGFPRVLLEAMAMGVPYVATDVGAVKEISPKTAQKFLVKSGDIEKFSHNIEILLNNKETYNQFKEEELEEVKKYDIDNVIEKFIRIIKE